MVGYGRYPHRQDCLQTAAALLATQAASGTLDWVSLASASLLAGITSLGTSLAGLPELERPQ